MGERTVRIRKVRGSNPLISTNFFGGRRLDTFVSSRFALPECAIVKLDIEVREIDIKVNVNL